MSERTALYRFFDADDVLLYVGITNRLERRWSHHARHKSWWPQVQRQTAEWFATRQEAEAAEKEAIGSEHPLYNTTYAVIVLTPEEQRAMEEARAELMATDRHWQDLQQQTDAARTAFFDLCAQRVSQRLDSADTIAARSSPTAVTIRKELRARGVEPLSRGPKRKQPAEPKGETT